MSLGNLETGSGGSTTVVNNITQADVVGFNEFTHNLGDFRLYFAHENQFSSLFDIRVNGEFVNFENLLNTTSPEAGRLNFSTGVNGTFNKRANTVEAITKVGDYFQFSSGNEAAFDTIFIALSDETVQANTALESYRVRITNSGYSLTNRSNVEVASGGQENGTYRFTRTLYGFEFSFNGSVVYTSPEVCIDHEANQLKGSSTINPDGSGYLDIGEVRIQWGGAVSSLTGAVRVDFPESFADNQYSISVVPISAAGTNRIVTSSSLNSTGFSFRNVAGNGLALVSENVSWKAIGRKP